MTPPAQSQTNTAIKIKQIYEPDDGRIVSHDAFRFILYYHCVRDVISIIQLSRSEKKRSPWRVSELVLIQKLLLSRKTTYSTFTAFQRRISVSH